MLFSGHYLSLWFLDSDEANCYFTLRGARVTGQQGEGQAGKSDYSSARHGHRRRRLHESARARQGGHVTVSDLGRCRQAILQYSDGSLLHHYRIIYYFKN
jgi:hypothetical protein